MTAEVETAVIGILARQALLPEAAVPLDARLEEIGLDSLGMAEALFALEERFDISIPFNANVPDAAQFDMTSVQSVVQAVERLIAHKAA
ncbi:acyl carrier protein [Tabrizicola sp. BL-A-41-H6]|uniref:acyl carrier protein n=1 Tax=Tabrizicola sp. BL-A-41-H6 TaxID=3421107 RepID=UPI003D67E235